MKPPIPTPTIGLWESGSTLSAQMGAQGGELCKTCPVFKVVSNKETCNGSNTEQKSHIGWDLRC